MASRRSIAISSGLFQFLPVFLLQIHGHILDFVIATPYFQASNPVASIKQSLIMLTVSVNEEFGQVSNGLFFLD